MRSTATLLAALLSFVLAGCASYQLGSGSSTLPYRSIEVSTPLNRSTLPQLQTPLASALRQAILQSSALELDTDADAQLLVEIVEVRRSIAAVDSSDLGRGRKFDLEVVALVTLRHRDPEQEAYLSKRPVSVTVPIFSDSGQVEAERQARPQIANALAERILQMLTERWD